MSIFDQYQEKFQGQAPETMSLPEYLELCKTDTMAYANIYERLLNAIGKPEIIDTSKDQKLSRLHGNRIIKRYPAFNDFFGMESSIDDVVQFLIKAADGGEQKKQILYLLGPVGSAKSSLAQRLAELTEKHAIYTIDFSDLGDVPVFPENPLGLFSKDRQALKEEYGIDERYIPVTMSPMATRLLEEVKGDLSKIKVIKRYPSEDIGFGISRTEPGDENTQDITSLVGKSDIRKLEDFSESDTRSYDYSGALSQGNMGLVEYVEMFKSPIKTLNPLLSATQDGKFKPSATGLSTIPFNGLILAHSNESEWEGFRNNNRNEAFLDRVCIVRVKYCLQVSEEVKIYQKYVSGTSNADADIAPHTLETLSDFMVMSRLTKPENASSLYAKLRVYNGENKTEVGNNACTYDDYQKQAGVGEGMEGASPRFGFKIISDVCADIATEEEHLRMQEEGAKPQAHPVALMRILEEAIIKEQFKKEREDELLKLIKEHLVPNYRALLDKDINQCYAASHEEFAQQIFDQYFSYADKWIQGEEYRDPQSGNLFDMDRLDQELAKIEKPAGISNPKDFRNEFVNFVLRASRNGKAVSWKQDKKFEKVVTAQLKERLGDIASVIRFGAKSSDDEIKKHEDFVSRMVKIGYTKEQVKYLVGWFLDYQKSA